ncbi:MAG: hypothetical protein K9K35_03570 [Rhodoferax sp.]|nr:hypothetical protein [Rhodoferax sp.]
MFKSLSVIKTIVGTAMLGLALASHVAAGISQTPLLTQSGSVSPNLMFIMDDSGSMNGQYLCQYGGTPGGYGVPCPGGSASNKNASCPTTLNIDSTCSYNSYSVTLSGGAPKATPPTWTATTYSMNAYVLGSDGKVYQCELSSGCTASFNPASPTVTPLPLTWVEGNTYNIPDLVTWNGEVWKCTSSRGCTASSSSRREPNSGSSRWTSQGLTSDWGTDTNPWSAPGQTLASYVGTTSVLTATGPFVALSPDVNRITYDPRVRYRTRLTGTDINTTTAAAPYTGSFFVFFYGAGGSVTPKVSQIWNGTTTYGDATVYGSYFAPYTDAARAASTTPTSALATDATTGLSYPQCVGPCAGVSSTLTNSSGEFPKFAARSDCAGTYCTLLEEQQNYGTWRKFYSNRSDLAKSGLGYAFQFVNAGLRLGWAEISDLVDGATTLGTMGSGVSELNQTRKTEFYTWLYGRRPNSNTPLRESLDAAGQYFKRADNKGPWAVTPDPTSKGLSTLATDTSDTVAIRAKHPSCRRSYTMLLTDGYYNGTDPGTGSISSGGTNDSDTKAITTITGTTPDNKPLTYSYNGTTKPYAKSSTIGEMSDIAMYYWITDLRTDLTNNVPRTVSTVSKYLNNDSFWQNMGFYAITLGIDGTLPQTNATLDAITAGSQTWSAPASDSPKAVDDLWHATVNGRGRLLNAKNADELSDGIEGMLAEINKTSSSQSGVATSAPNIKVESAGASYKYTPSYTTGSWIGSVVSYKLDATSGAATCINWQVGGSIVTLGDTTAGAAQPLPRCFGVTSGTTSGLNTTYKGIAASGSRAIFTWSSTGYGNFDSNNSFVTGKIPGGTTKALIDYLRGDQTNEEPNGTAKYRPREQVLGDIVNSTPTFIQGVLNSRFDQLPVGTPGQDNYSAFLAKKTAREGVLFAGANDGMLHGFRDGSSVTNFTNGGQEVFAFVPRAALPNLNKLAGKSYDHQYFVDGPTVEADACYLDNDPKGAGCKWTNMLLGTTGAGSPSVYAINVDFEVPTDMKASDVRWEITPTDRSYGSALTTSTDYKDLGNVLSDVQTGFTMNGKWVAVFGNGFHGTGDTKAHLYIADLATGEKIADIIAGTDTNNGLGGVILVKDSKQRIIGAYAGDLKGSMWKFDLSSTTSSSWGVGLSGSPLFKTATTPIKPITAAPTLVAHPKGGAVVVFGTGKLFDDVPDDLHNTDLESVYGVWDSEPFGATSTAAVVPQTDLTNLVQQTITTTAFTGLAVSGTGTIAQDYFTVSKNAVDWTTKRGWYLNLTNATGQRVIYPISTLMGKYAAVDTMAPPALVNPDACSVAGSGKAWNYVIDMITGGGAGSTDPIFDTNGDGIVDSKDALVSGYTNSADGRTRYVKNDTLSTSTQQIGYGSGFSYVEDPVTHTFGTKISSLSSSNSNKVTVIDALGGTNGGGAGGLASTLNDCKAAINGCTTPGVVKRTWRQLYMR